METHPPPSRNPSNCWRPRPPCRSPPRLAQTAEAFSNIFEPLSKHYRFLALDPPGLGDSSPPTNGYDTANVSKLLAEGIHDTLKDEQRYDLIGHDVGGWIAYPWAAEFQSRLKSLSILDASVPGFQPPFQFPLSPQTNLRLWQFSFNALSKFTEILTSGRERELLTWFFNLKIARADGYQRINLNTISRPIRDPG
ncbi:Alpha/Beta hydrolase protein [Aspergillus crustosus]